MAVSKIAGKQVQLVAFQVHVCIIHGKRMPHLAAIQKIQLPSFVACFKFMKGTLSAVTIKPEKLIGRTYLYVRGLRTNQIFAKSSGSTVL